MIGGREILVVGVYFVALISVASADSENTGVIVASCVAGALFLAAFAGITVYCFYRKGGFSNKKHKKSHKKPKYVANGAPPQEKHRKHHRYVNNNYKIYTNYQVNGIPPGVHHFPTRPVVHPYATYHGPPADFYQPPPPMHPGTMSGPPPMVVIPTPHGTVTMRADPRPVIQKKRDNRHHRTAREVLEEPRRKKRSHSQPPSEFLIEQSPDGIPVIRPVIYEFVDDEKDNRHRSKSRHKSRDRTPSGAQVTEIKVSDTEAVVNTVEEVEVHQRERPRSRSRSKSPVGPSPMAMSPERSRASSVTEAVNALRMSVRQHGGKDIDTDTASELNDSSPFSPVDHDQRAPDPVAGDVLFFPAGVQPPSLRASHKPRDIQPEPKHGERVEEVYSYTKLIRASTNDHTEKDTGERDDTSNQKNSPVLIRASFVKSGATDAARSSTRANYLGTRDLEPKPYETEHTVQGVSYTTDIKASMSDRITSLVEDGDKSRFSHYNVGAVTLGDESGDDEVDTRVPAARKRAPTPPSDFRSSLYSKPIRPSTPPNDIPLISPSESTDIPRLNLQSSSATPRVMHLYRPESPPRDFPITPQSSIIRPRPTTPPFDADTHRDTQRDSQGIQRDSQRESMISSRSEAVNPATGEPGSFQARKRLIERHLQQNVVQGGDKGNTNPKVAHKTGGNIPHSEPRAQTSIQPTRTTIRVSPGVVPPAPPPPPMPGK